MGSKKLHLAFAIVFAFLFVGSLGVLIVFLFSEMFINHPFISLAVLGATLVTSILTVYFSIKYITIRSELETLINDNIYNLGEKTTFFGVPAFVNRVDKLCKNRRLAKKKQFVISFTAANLSTMQNANRDDSITLLNARIASYLSKFVHIAKSDTRRKRRRDRVVCFNRGSFLVYLFLDNEHDVRHIVDEISNHIFEIAEEHQIHIYVQPFFGVAEIEEEKPLLESIEDANIARNVSERNFETLTYYHDSFRRRSSKEEIEEITEALKNNEFVVYYQPKFNLNTRRFISAEALVRWNSSKHGLLPPNKFIPVVEAAGLIHEIDTFVFKRVCEDLNEAKRRGTRLLPVSINFSLYEFYSSEFLNSIMELLDKYQINPSYIEIEITEATSRANTFTAISIIKKLRDKGIRVLMDDFGVGFSNIGNLRKMPFDAVKIDKSFIDDIVTDLKSRAIVKFLIELCLANDLEVIAEGVDDKDQVEILKKLKCNTIQGWYYSQALPQKEYEKFLLNNPFERKENNN